MRVAGDRPAIPPATAAADAEMIRYQVGLENAGLGLWDADLKAGRCYYSDTWKAMLGYAPDEIPEGEDVWLALIHPDDKDRAIQVGEDHKAGLTPIAEVEFRMRHKDGRWVWLLDRGKVVERDAAGEAVRMIGVQTEITRIKEAEQEMQFLAERTQLAVETAEIGLWHADADGGRLHWDRRTQEIFGTEAVPETLKAWNALVHPEEREAVYQDFRDALQSDRRYDGHYRIVRPSGDIRRVHTLARIVRQRDGRAFLIGTCWDVTEQMSAAEALAAEKERLRITLHSIADAVICTDMFGRVSFMNLAAETLTGYVEPTAVGNPLEAVFRPIHEESGAALPSLAAEARRLKTAVEQPFPAILVRPDGSQRAIRDIASPVVAANGEVVGAVLVAQDVTAARALQRDLAHAATHDALTGLKNRAFFVGVLQRTIEAGRETRLPSALLYLDLDRFKILNDTAGHHAGDALLRQIATTLSGLARRHDVVARLGGDEFAVLLMDCTETEAERIAEAIVEEIGLIRFPWGERIYEIGASIGLAPLDAETPTAEAALSHADVACYAAKAAGRNRVAVFRPDSGDAYRHMVDLKVAAGIREAIEEDRFRLFGQEIRNLDRPRERGRSLEILTRMVTKDGSYVPPGAFIPPAERFELMASLDRWVLRTAIRRYGAAIMAVPDLAVAINLSANSLSDPALWTFLSGELQAGVLDPRRLVLEITETAMINNFGTAERFVTEARARGCRVSLDDFGSGVSSFSYLKRFAVDALKIDGSFVRQMRNNAFDRAIIRMIAEVAESLGVDAIAECIEDAETRDALVALGIRRGQGYFFHRPEPLSDVLAGYGVGAAQDTRVA